MALSKGLMIVHLCLDFVDRDLPEFKLSVEFISLPTLELVGPLTNLIWLRDCSMIALPLGLVRAAIPVI